MPKQIRCCFPVLRCIVGISGYVEAIYSSDGAFSNQQGRTIAVGEGSASAAPTEMVLYSFQGDSDGSDPRAALIADADGNLYGTTSNGGSPGCGSGCGTVFKLSPDGTETVLHVLPNPCIMDCSDGIYPYAGLIADSAGNLYGTTDAGGDRSCSPGGCGVVFKISAGGTFTVLHSFTGYPNDGIYPEARLIADQSGNLYGTTRYGGASCASSSIGPVPGCGTRQSVAALAAQYGSLEAAAAALPWQFGFPGVPANATGTTNPVPVSLNTGIAKCRSAA